MKRSMLLPALLLAYAITVAVGIEAINSAWGNLLPNRDGPQEGSGYGKMRGAMGEFQTILCLLGTWVYPACAIACVRFVRQGIETKSLKNRALFFACTALSLAILARFFWLGVFTEGWAQFL
jgi:hypothetical protein